ncbi:hypothetical protein PMPD1_0746 [Paramixta manurensis]|uniref:Uncharacterized protein n=1 Tax=Paramixta manurensis TaxID=2740817 RepID=A0A6M8U502_9GAMM|nr:hypothetical protein PMPD1_0746 [Erwiniaceae bacterium PD-1]
MKITGTRSYIVLDENGRKIKVKGEMIVGGFIADVSSMKKFEPPYENEVLTEGIKRDYIDKTIKKTTGTHMVITFE